jgi:hypothetical protein
MKRTILGLTLLVGVSGCGQTDLTSAERILGQSVATLIATPLQLDLTSGTTGTVFFNQSFNGETRGVDVTVLGSADLVVNSITLREFNILDAAATVGARIYSPGGALLASGDAAVDTGFNQTVTIPISATLIAGSGYRIAFFIPTATHGNSADEFDPGPQPIDFTGFPYTESNGVLSIDGAWDIVGDVFPTTINAFVPMIALEVTPAETTIVQLGRTVGYWSNKNGNRALDHSPKNGIVDDSVPPDSLGGSPGRSFYVDEITESNKILKNNACTSGSPTIFNCAAPPAGDGLSKGLKVGTLNTLAAQTLTLYYNIRLIGGYAPQTIQTLSTSTHNCASLVTSPLVGLALTPASTVTDVLVLANLEIQYSVATSLGGSTTQAQASAMNSLLGCLNRETL